VVEAAADGLEPAEGIVGRAVEELAGAVEAVRRRLGPWADAPELALAGGLLAPGGSLRGRVIEALESRPVRIRAAPVDPARGAAAMALREVEPPGPGGSSPG
jgi:N-acetylglucosamine kinase-like BadF-type ATPase